MKKKRTPMKYVAMMALCAVCILGAGVSFLMAEDSKREFEVQYQDNLTSIRLKKAELEQLQSYEPDNVTVVRSHISSAAEAGRALAALQEEYWEEDESAEATVEHVTRIKNDILERLALGARGSGIWYISAANWPGEFRWTFESNYDFAGNVIPCVWTCWDLHDKLVAYAVGEYDAGNDVFGDIESHVTMYGSFYSGVDDVLTRPEDYEARDLAGMQEALGIDPDELQNGDSAAGMGLHLKPGFNGDGSLQPGWMFGPDGDPVPIPGYEEQTDDEGQIPSGWQSSGQSGDTESPQPDMEPSDESLEPSDGTGPQPSDDGFVWEGGDGNG